jgi:hypothetical protein
MSWASLPPKAKAFRAIHAAWSVAGVASLGWIWLSAIRRRRDRPLAAAVAFLGVEGAGLLIGRGDCPMGARQREWGDPKPFFELLLPPRAAKAAVPVLAWATVLGLVAVAIRPPRTRAFGPPPTRSGEP